MERPCRVIAVARLATLVRKITEVLRDKLIASVYVRRRPIVLQGAYLSDFHFDQYSGDDRPRSSCIGFRSATYIFSSTTELG